MDTSVLDEVITGRVEPHIYAFKTNTIPNYLKVGDTYRPVAERLQEWKKYFPDLQREFDDKATVSMVIFFRDYAVHQYLEKELGKIRLKKTDIEDGIYFSNEFFKEAEKADIENAIADIKTSYDAEPTKYLYYKTNDSMRAVTEYKSTGYWNPRQNQKDAINKFCAAVNGGRSNLLMYAVMRFGKTFTSLCCAKEMPLPDGSTGAKIVLVVSAKADVKEEWRKTVQSADNFKDYKFLDSERLKEENIIDDEIADNILGALDQLIEDGYNELVFDPSVEDIHMAIENYVTDKIGPTAGFMHTAKSRNDQVATDVRLVLRDKITETQIGILEFMEGLVEKAGEHLETVFIGYTHLQHAQPITIAHHLMAHVQALKRDYERLEDTYKRVNLNPLGSAAMTTTSFPINRQLTTDLLGFDAYLENSMDGVSSRDFISETVFDLSALCTTLSKICEELILWSTYEFGIIEMADEYSSTSSIMPQKKNPEVAELARAKSTIVNGELVTILTILKAIPYTYNRDLQEITPHLWNAVKVTQDTLSIVTKMLLSVKFKEDRCLELAGTNFATATDLADIMVREKQIPFRTAHKIVGRIVNEATASGLKEADITSEYIDDIASELGFEKLGLEDDLVQKALNPLENVKMRTVPGGPSPAMVEIARDNIKEFLNEEFEKKGI